MIFVCILFAFYNIFGRIYGAFRAVFYIFSASVLMFILLKISELSSVVAQYVTVIINLKVYCMLFSNLDAKVQKIFVNQKFSDEKDLIFS